MSIMCRLATKTPYSLQQLYSKKPNLITLTRHVTLKSVPYTPPIKEDHDEHNAKLNRPQSPHLSIYAWQLTSALSISHRMTGAALSGYTILLGCGALLLPEQISHYIEALQAAHPGVFVMSTFKFILAFPFSFHFCNGIRHLTWDTGKFLTIKGVYQTGYIMLASSVLMSLVLTFM